MLFFKLFPNKLIFLASSFFFIPLYRNHYIASRSILGQIQIIVIAFQLHQFIVASALLNAPVTDIHYRLAFRMVDRRCAMTKEVLPLSSCSRPFCTSSSVCVSTGGRFIQNQNTGSASKARAKEISCRCPWESLEPRSFTSV